MTDTDGLIAVHLHHPLSDQFGALHHFNIHTPLEALVAIDANYPSFLREFQKVPEYWIVVDGDLKHYSDFKDPEMKFQVHHEVHFVPKVEGNAFLGTALVGAIFPSLVGTTAATILGGLLMAGVFIGLSLLLAPKTKKEKETKKDENYAFSGPENVTAQGVPVPLLYGRCHCGSVVVSASLILGGDLPPDGSAGLQTMMLASFDDPGLEPPPSGWPPIEEFYFRPVDMSAPAMRLYGPKGWDYVGTVGKMLIDNARPEKAEVDYFRSPRQTWAGAPAEYYGWDQASGFHIYNPRMLAW
jgi:predicted phage tail protein